MIFSRTYGFDWCSGCQVIFLSSLVSIGIEHHLKFEYNFRGLFSCLKNLEIYLKFFTGLSIAAERGGSTVGRDSGGHSGVDIT